MTSKTTVKIAVEKTETGHHFVATCSNGQVFSHTLVPAHPLYDKCAEFGFGVALRNVNAGVTDPDTQADNVSDFLENFEAGVWGRRKPGEGRAPAKTLLARAVSNVTGQPIEKAAVWLESLSNEAKSKVRADDRIKKEILELRLEALQQAPVRVEEGVFAGIE